MRVVGSGLYGAALDGLVRTDRGLPKCDGGIRWTGFTFQPAISIFLSAIAMTFSSLRRLAVLSCLGVGFAAAMPAFAQSTTTATNRPEDNRFTPVALTQPGALDEPELAHADRAFVAVLRWYPGDEAPRQLGQLRALERRLLLPNRGAEHPDRVDDQHAGLCALLSGPGRESGG